MNPFTGGTTPIYGFSDYFIIDIDACASCSVTKLVAPDVSNAAEHPYDILIGATGVSEDTGFPNFADTIDEVCLTIANVCGTKNYELQYVPDFTDPSTT